MRDAKYRIQTIGWYALLILLKAVFLVAAMAIMYLLLWLLSNVFSLPFAQDYAIYASIILAFLCGGWIKK